MLPKKKVPHFEDVPFMSNLVIVAHNGELKDLD